MTLPLRKKKKKVEKVLVSVLIYKTGSDLHERLSVVTKLVNIEAQTHWDGRRLSPSHKSNVPSLQLISQQRDQTNCVDRMAAYLHLKHPRDSPASGRCCFFFFLNEYTWYSAQNRHRGDAFTHGGEIKNLSITGFEPPRSETNTPQFPRQQSAPTR